MRLWHARPSGSRTLNQAECVILNWCGEWLPWCHSNCNRRKLYIWTQNSRPQGSSYYYFWTSLELWLHCKWTSSHWARWVCEPREASWEDITQIADGRRLTFYLSWLEILTWKLCDWTWRTQTDQSESNWLRPRIFQETYRCAHLSKSRRALYHGVGSNYRRESETPGCECNCRRVEHLDCVLGWRRLG